MYVFNHDLRDDFLGSDCQHTFLWGRQVPSIFVTIGTMHMVFSLEENKSHDVLHVSTKVPFILNFPITVKYPFITNQQIQQLLLHPHCNTS